MFLGLRTVIYPTTDLDGARSFVTAATGVTPYFDEPFYVGFDVGGFELALDPNGDPDRGVLAYWGVVDIDAAVAGLEALGAEVTSGIDEVGDDIRVATLRMPGSPGPLGVIQNPHYRQRIVESPGPGR